MEVVVAAALAVVAVAVAVAAVAVVVVAVVAAAVVASVVVAVAVAAAVAAMVAAVSVASGGEAGWRETPGFTLKLSPTRNSNLNTIQYQVQPQSQALTQIRKPSLNLILKAHVPLL